MNDKIVTKHKLASINRRALKAGSNAIDPELVKRLPAHLRYPVSQALPFPERPGWVRCWVGIGTTMPPTTEDFQSLLLDIPVEDFEKLPAIDM